MGSVLFLAAWSVMMGPIQYGKQALFAALLAAHLHAYYILLTTTTPLQSNILSLDRDCRSRPRILGASPLRSTFPLV
jgi:hypothetical protein